MEQNILIEDYEDEIFELEYELRNLIEYDEWAGREYGEVKVDYYSTAINMLNAGYRRVDKVLTYIESNHTCSCGGNRKCSEV